MVRFNSGIFGDLALERLLSLPQLVLRLHVDPGLRAGTKPTCLAARPSRAYAGVAVEHTRQRHVAASVTDTAPSAKTPSFNTSPEGCYCLALCCTCKTSVLGGKGGIVSASPK